MFGDWNLVIGDFQFAACTVHITQLLMKMRICSLLPSATEILFALGLEDSVCGVSHECDYPPAAAKKHRILRSCFQSKKLSSSAIDDAVQTAVANRQSLYVIDEVALKSIRPDLIITQSLCPVCAIDTSTVTQITQQLSPAPEILSLHPHRLDDVLQDILIIGERTQRQEQASQFVRALKERLERVNDFISQTTERPRVFCLEWMEPLMASGHWIPEMVSLAGGREVLGCAGESSIKVEWNQISEQDPDVIIVMPCGFSIQRTRQEISLLTQNTWWWELRAVQNKQVYLVDGSSYFHRSGPRLIDGIELLARLLHPRFRELIPCGGVERL